ncbi:MAG TPA: GNAT family protein [Acidimicrobiales bacterium]|nr:GNAT family protein [Acidimicrobiales bacterium]
MNGEIPVLAGKRVVLRLLEGSDFDEWSAVRVRNERWLTPWEPRTLPGRPDVVRDRRAFAARCSARMREAQFGSGYGFGIFVDQAFAGEINLTSIQRGPLQCADIGYWIDQKQAGNSYMPESVVVVCRFGFERLALHRLQVAIIPRNRNSRRVMEKLAFREEGVAQRLVEINGVWEDHVRYAITAEEWDVRRAELSAAWL